MQDVISRGEAKSRGLKRYFTGKPCRNGHLAEKLVSNYLCVECLRAHVARYKVVHSDRQAARKSRYYEANKDRYREYDKQARVVHRASLNEKQKLRYRRDIERSRAMRRAARKRRAEHHRARSRERYRLNPEAAIATSRRSQRRHADRGNARAALRRAAKLKATPVWANLTEIRRFYAEARRFTAETGIRYEVDHIVPLSSDLVCGLHTHTNLRVITARENSSKKNRLVEELLC